MSIDRIGVFPRRRDGIVTVTLGCGNGTRPPDSSISPSPSPTPAPDTTFYTLSGVVFEATSNGNAPRSGVDIYCDRCGPTGHTWVSTGDNGVYVFSHVPNGDTPLVVRRGRLRGDESTNTLTATPQLTWSSTATRDSISRLRRWVPGIIDVDIRWRCV